MDDKHTRRASGGQLSPLSAMEVFHEASIVLVVDRDVVVLGPAGVGFSMTPEAAIETAQRMLTAADDALNSKA